VPEWEQLRELASQIKEHTLSNLAHYLEMFESRAKANDVTVHWAQDDPAEIVENIHDAYSHPHFRNRAYSLLMSGPSGSADIAGTTVHPAQGVTTLTVIFWPMAAAKKV
jgi:hypothetical protein